MLLYQIPVLLAYVPLLGYSALGREGGHVWAVKVQGGGERAERELQAIADTVANNLGLVNHGRIEPFHNVFQFEGSSRRVGRSAVAAVHASLEGHAGVVWASLQRPLTRTKREVEFRDPFFSKQWHLVNHHKVGHDINVTGVWSDNITGLGVVVAVVDDGLEHTNQDIAQNYNALGSYDFNDNDNDPMPNLKSVLDNSHGTKCGGLIAAVANNVCAVGVAYRAQVSGIRMLDGTVTDILEGKSFLHKAHTNWIYSCSWGPEDKGATVEGPGLVAQEALTLSVSKGRYGYGNVFVFASGNGGSMNDNCNYDGYANSVYTVTVGAVNEGNHMPYYAELCPAMLAVTYSNGIQYRSIVTTDASTHSGCTQSFSGTSAAAPIASGMIALMLQVRPCLSWRDVQSLLVYTAVKVDVDGAQWVRNTAGFYHSDQHGFGLMDAYRMSRAAGVWPLLPTIHEVSFPQTQHTPLVETVRLTQTVGVANLPSELYTLEYVQVTVTVDHLCRGALEFSLTSPHNTTSILATTRKHDKTTDGLDDWTFTTAKFWGETPLGLWTLTITDHPQFCGYAPHNGVLRKWVLILQGSKVTQEDINQRRRLVEEAVSNDTVWSPLPCPPVPSDPQDLTLSDTEQPSLPTVHVFTVTVTTPTTTRWEKLVIVVVAVIVGVLLLHCVSDQLWEKVKARMRHRSSSSAVRFTRNTHSETHRQSEETVMLLVGEEEGREEVIGEGGSSEDHQQIALPNDEQGENASLLHVSTSSPSSQEWNCEPSQQDGVTPPSTSTQELLTHTAQEDICHSSELGNSNMNGSPPTDGLLLAD